MLKKKASQNTPDGKVENKHRSVQMVQSNKVFWQYQIVKGSSRQYKAVLSSILQIRQYKNVV